MINVNKYSGCFLGLALGDALGAPFEGGILERSVWRLISKTKDGLNRYTDDTQTAIDLSHSFLIKQGIDQDHLAKTFAENYRWSRGYGPAATWLLKKIKNGADWRDVNKAKYENGSFGNGAAMRAPIIALCSPKDRETLNLNVIRCSEITHAHPLAIEGARLIANTTCDALNSMQMVTIIEYLLASCQTEIYQKKLKLCSEYVASDKTPDHKQIKKNLGNGIAAIDSCVTSIYFALKYMNKPFEEMRSIICELGGDVDTISAMAGGIWGAFNGLEALDGNQINQLESNKEILRLSQDLYDVVYRVK